MKKIILSCAAIIFINYFSFNQTIIPGGNVSGTWSISGSPYYVQGSISIPNDSTLTIEPGVTVNFQNNYQLQVNGRLLAEGIGTDTIIFTAANHKIGWQGIRFPSTASINDSSKIINCKLEYGYSASGGGALCFTNFSKAIVSHSAITNCRANSNGGGIYCDNSSIIISNNIISDNSGNTGAITGYYGDYGGGGIYCKNSNPTIVNNTISGNMAYAGGAGILCWQSNPIISNNIISNSVLSGFCQGGGIYCYISCPLISNNIISNNISGEAGGIYCVNSNPIISNNIFSNNSAVPGNSYVKAGGIYCISSSPTISNCIFVNNNAFYGGALYCDNNSNPTFINCIFWGNTVSKFGAQVYLNDEASDPKFYYCDVRGGTSAFELNGNFYTGIYQNNIDTDPLFVAPSSGTGTGFNGVLADWSLQNCSPCLNSGDPAPLYTYPKTDIIGNLRVAGGRIDIGAYENQTAHFVSVNIIANPEVPICTGTNVTFTPTTTNAGNSPSFQWKVNGKNVSTGSTFTSSLLVNNDTVTCILISSDTCVVGNPAISNALSIIVNPLPPTPFITQITSNILTSSASTGNQWYNDSGIIVGATNQMYSPLSDGNYYIIVTVKGCESNKSNVINFVNTGILNLSLNNENIGIYPNPATDYIHIETQQKLELEIIDIEGQILKLSSIIDKVTTIDVRNLSSGVYIIKAKTEKGIFISKFLKE
jgi:hypothetical protein